MDGAPEKIRTSGLQLRRLPLYPAELRAHLWYQQLSKMTSPTNPEDSIQNCYYTRGGSRESHAFKIPDGNNPKGQKTQRNCLGVALPGRSRTRSRDKRRFRCRSFRPRKLSISLGCSFGEVLECGRGVSKSPAGDKQTGRGHGLNVAESGERGVADLLAGLRGARNDGAGEVGGQAFVEPLLRQQIADHGPAYRPRASRLRVAAAAAELCDCA